MEEMDALEQMAWDLEEAQSKRFEKAKFNENAFWNENEIAIFETIKLFREKSNTFNADNYR